MKITNTYEFGSDDIKSNQINFVNEFNENDNVCSVRDAYAFYIQNILKKIKI